MQYYYDHYALIGLSGKVSAITIASVVIIILLCIILMILLAVLAIARRFKNKTRTSKQTHTNM